MQFKHIIWNLTKKEIDMVNVLINIVEMYDKFDVGHTFDYNSPIYMLDLTYHDLAASLGYSTLNYKIMQEINSILDNLSKTHAAIFYTNDDNDRFMENTTLLLKYTLSSTSGKDLKRDHDKRFSIMLSTSLVKVLRENKDLFKKFYTHDRYDLRGKYSTILYDVIATQAKGSNTVAINFTIDEFIDLIDFDLEESTNTESWTKINSNILKRAAKEINNKSNMYFHYDKIKEKLTHTGRTQTTGVKFEISLAPEAEETYDFFDDDFLMERKISYYIEKEINRKVNELKKFNDNRIKNEDGYRFTESQKLQKQKDEFEAKVKIQDLVNWVKYNYHGENGLVCFFGYEDNEYITVNSDHKLMNVETKKILSKNAIDTYNKIKKLLADEGEYGLLDVDNNRDYSISYAKG